MGYEGACTWQVCHRPSLLSSSFCRAVVKDPGTGLAFAARTGLGLTPLRPHTDVVLWSVKWEIIRSFSLCREIMRIKSLPGCSF